MNVATIANTPDLDALSVAELKNELTEVASHIYAGTCRWLELVAELDRREGWAEPGLRSCAEWIAWRCALTPRAAREHVRVARRLGELPRIRDSFARGELSYAKVRALTRVADGDSEEELLELAACMTAAQLERAVRAYRRVTAEEANEAHENAYLDHYWDEDGSLVLSGRLAPEDGALFLRALEAARDSLWQRDREEEGGGSAEPRTPTNAEAVVAVADAALTREDANRTGGERYQVVVHVDGATLSGEGDRGCALDDGPAVAPETARRLSCDSSLVRIVEQGGEALDVGRKTRTIPPSLRRALKARDRGCRFPGCENHRFVDAHHVRHWSQGGATSIDNLMLLCRRHHRLVHEGGYAVECLPRGRLRFRDQRGSPVPSVPRPPRGGLDRLVERNLHSGRAIGPETCLGGTGERMDLSYAVDALLQIAGQTEARFSGRGQAFEELPERLDEVSWR